MKFTVTKKEIINELQLLQGIVEKRNTMPILANVLIEASENEIKLIGTDLEVGMVTYCNADIKDKGSTTLAGKKLFEIVRSLPDESDIDFDEEKEGLITIKSGVSEFKISSLPEEDYPKIPIANFTRGIKLPLDLFHQMIDKIYFTITQEHRYYLNGALMILNGNSWELVSTDGHRLAYTFKKDVDLNIPEQIQIIISKKALNELRKMDDDAAEFDFDENNLFFKAGKRILISRIIEGKFPDFKAVIPQDNENILTVSRDELITSIKRVALLSSERARGVKFYIKGNQLELFSSNPEIGEARDMVKVNYSGNNIEIAFNSQYILDFLNIVHGETIRFEIKDENSAVLIKPGESEEVGYLYVLMPMKI